MTGRRKIERGVGRRPDYDDAREFTARGLLPQGQNMPLPFRACRAGMNDE
jgi:hypothetical protein